MTFDTESNLYRDPTFPIIGIDSHRKFVFERRPRFDCGAIYDSEVGKVLEFQRNEAEAMVTMLLQADLLVSHSGKRVDLPILEYQLGTNWPTSILSIPHFDFLELPSLESLENLCARYVSKSDCVEIEFARSERFNKNQGHSIREFTESKLSKACRDTLLTWKIWNGMGNPIPS